MNNLVGINNDLRNKKWYFLITYLFSGIIILLFVFFRPLNHDETYYIISANSLLFEGKLPYTDFVFHQAPLILIAYMPISDFGLYSIFAGRILSGILLLISFYMLSSTFFTKNEFKIKLLFTVFFWFNMFLIDWAVTIKVYSLSIFLLSAGIFFYSKFLNKPEKINYLLPAFFFFSLLAYTKIVFCVNYIFILLFTLYIMNKNGSFSNIFKTILFFTLALLLPGFFFWAFLRPDFDKLIFDLFTVNVLYTSFTRFTDDIKGFLIFYIIPQNLIIMVFAFFSLKRDQVLVFFILFNYLIFFFLHFSTRMLAEYHVSFLPLLIVLAAVGFRNLLNDKKLYFKKSIFSKMFVIVLLLYLMVSPFSIYHFKQFIFSSKLPPNPLELSDFTAKINALKGKTILSSWEGLTVFSNKETIYKENYAISYVSDFINEETKKKFNLVTKSNYEMLISGSIPDIIVIDAANAAHLSNMESLIEKRYEISFQFNYITVFIKKIEP
jgi:hypothetical protein